MGKRKSRSNKRSRRLKRSVRDRSTQQKGGTKFVGSVVADRSNRIIDWDELLRYFSEINDILIELKGESWRKDRDTVGTNAYRLERQMNMALGGGVSPGFGGGASGGAAQPTFPTVVLASSVSPGFGSGTSGGAAQPTRTAAAASTGTRTAAQGSTTPSTKTITGSE